MLSTESLNLEFKKLHNEIILENDIILYNDAYMKILVGNSSVVVLDTKSKIYPISPQVNTQCPDNINMCKLSYYDMEKLSLTKEYTKSITYRNKLVNNLTNDIRKMSIYSADNIKVYSLLYFVKKFKLDKLTLNVIYIQDNDKERNDNNFDLLNRCNFNVKFITSLENIGNLLSKNSCFIQNLKTTSIHNYSEYVHDFIKIYNALIKLPNNSNTYFIFIRPVLMTKLQFQIIDILKSYFKEAMLIKPKYDAIINCYLVLKEKIQDYKEIHYFDTNKFPDVLSINDSTLDKIYVDFYNTLTIKFNNAAYLVTVLKLLKKKNREEYKRIKNQINVYKEFYKLKINDSVC